MRTISRLGAETSDWTLDQKTARRSQQSLALAMLERQDLRARSMTQWTRRVDVRESR